MSTKKFLIFVMPDENYNNSYSFFSEIKTVRVEFFNKNHTIFITIHRFSFSYISRMHVIVAVL